MLSNPISVSAQQAFAAALAAFTSFQQLFDFAVKTQSQVRAEVPEKLLRGNYARQYARDYVLYNQTGRFENPPAPGAPPQGSLQTKLDFLDNNVLPLVFGNAAIGTKTLSSVQAPGSLSQRSSPEWSLLTTS